MHPHIHHTIANKILEKFVIDVISHLSLLKLDQNISRIRQGIHQVTRHVRTYTKPRATFVHTPSHAPRSYIHQVTRHVGTYTKSRATLVHTPSHAPRWYIHQVTRHVGTYTKLRATLVHTPSHAPRWYIHQVTRHVGTYTKSRATLVHTPSHAPRWYIHQVTRHVGTYTKSRATLVHTPSHAPRWYIHQVTRHVGAYTIQLCQTFDFKILNGRTSGDKIGNMTYFKNELGASTIDYNLCNFNFFNFIDDFLVLPMTGLSDHSKLIRIFKKNISRPEDQSDNYKWKILQSKFEWDPNKINEFSTALSTQLAVINEISQRIEAGIIDRAGESIQKLFIDAAKSCLGQKKPSTQQKKTKIKKMV